MQRPRLRGKSQALAREALNRPAATLAQKSNSTNRKVNHRDQARNPLDRESTRRQNQPIQTSAPRQSGRRISRETAMLHQTTIRPDWPITDFVITEAHAKHVSDRKRDLDYAIHRAERWPRELTAATAVLIDLMRDDLARAIEDQERHRASLAEAPPQQERTA